MLIDYMCNCSAFCMICSLQDAVCMHDACNIYVIEIFSVFAGKDMLVMLLGTQAVIPTFMQLRLN